MHDQSSRRFAHGDGWKAVELPYADGKLVMVVVLPDDGRFAAVADGLPQVLTQMNTAGGAEVSLALPKFDIASSLRLKPQLISLGMPTAFTESADFSGMSTNGRLHIANVIHQANITVNERGTVASAATAVIMRLASAPLHIEPMVVDRPFLYAIVDKPTGAILFAGQVTNPATKT
jgi:serpin B